MNEKTPHLDPSRILIFPFEDENWLPKILIASLLVLLSFIPIIPLVLLLGYGAEIIRIIVLENQEPTLPDWNDLSSLFNRGFRLFGVGAVYMIPTILLIGIGYLGFIIPVFLAEFGGMSEAESVILIIVGYIAGFGLMSVGTLISMITGIVLPIAGIHTAVRDDFQAGFKFKEIWTIFSANWSGFVIAFLILLGSLVVLYYGAYFLAATVILCCLYPFVVCLMSAYLLMVGAGYFGEAYRVASELLKEKTDSE
jgi:hypothetical protein